ncbi:hypothetical protein EIP86_008947 [Pleurotus ostreatoroseus]|nr:hypothetical protein EIP86_008947 [Pleurotus ostreatoroseus]
MSIQYVLTFDIVAEEQRKGWKTSVYNHFKPPEIVTVDGEIKYRFVCKKHLNENITRVRCDSSTSNLARHAKKCDGQEAPDTQKITEFAHGSTYSKARMRFLLAKWVSVRHRPYFIIKDPKLLEIFRMLYAKVEVPHPTTLSRDVHEIFKILRERLSLALEVSTISHSRNSTYWCVYRNTTANFIRALTAGLAPNVISFLGVTAQPVVKNKLQHFILDFIK